MNFELKQVPGRAVRPREEGLTMVMDKGLSLNQAKNLVEAGSEYIDLLKIGFGSAYVTPNLSEKIKIFREANITVFFGGTLLEAFIIRGQFDDFLRLMDKYDLDTVEVSDGSIHLSREEKCNYINLLSKRATVLSEIGSKDPDHIFPPYKWIEMINEEMSAGSWKVIAEAREGGNVGIYRGSGEVRSGLVDEILTKIPADSII